MIKNIFIKYKLWLLLATGIVLLILAYIISDANDKQNNFFNIKEVNLNKCIIETNKNIRIYNLGVIKSITTDSTAISMGYILNNIENNSDCYIKELGLNSSMDTLSIIQRVHSYITYHTEYKPDNKNEGVKTPDLFIYDNKGDCEDKAMFGLFIFTNLGLNVSILNVLPKRNSNIGHIALKINGNFFERDFIFNPADNMFKKIYSIEKDQIFDYDKSYKLDEINHILSIEDNYKVNSLYHPDIN